MRSGRIGVSSERASSRNAANFSALARATRARPVGAIARPRADGRDLVAQRREREPGIADHGDLGRVVDPDHRRVDVDVHHAHLARRRMPPALGGDRAGAAADEHDQVGLIDDGARLGRAAVAADHAERQRMVLGDAALAADRGGDGRVEQLGERAKLCRRRRRSPGRRRR